MDIFFLKMLNLVGFRDIKMQSTRMTDGVESESYTGALVLLDTRGSTMDVAL